MMYQGDAAVPVDWSSISRVGYRMAGNLKFHFQLPGIINLVL